MLAAQQSLSQNHGAAKFSPSLPSDGGEGRGEEARFYSEFPSPRSSPHSFLMGRGRNHGVLRRSQQRGPTVWDMCRLLSGIGITRKVLDARRVQPHPWRVRSPILVFGFKPAIAGSKNDMTGWNARVMKSGGSARRWRAISGGPPKPARGPHALPFSEFGYRRDPAMFSPRGGRAGQTRPAPAR